METWKSAWKEAGKVFLLSRLLFFTLTGICIYVIPRLVPPYLQRMYSVFPGRYPLYDIHMLLYSWLRFDVKAYLNISYFGYRHTPDVAFFPLWPLIQRLGGLLLGNSFPDSFYIAGLLLANIFFYFALVLFYRLLAEDFYPELARKALYCLAFAPYALFYFAGYSESLFLVLCLSVFLLLRREGTWNWWLAGLLAYLAVLTRSSGIALAFPYLIMYYRRYWTASKGSDSSRWQKLLALVPIVFIPAAILSYMYYLYVMKGSPLIFRVQEETIWYRHFTFPWDTLGLLAHSLSFSEIVSSPTIVDITFVLIALITLILGWNRLPLQYQLFALALVVFSLSFPTHTIEPFASQPRYMLSIFPIFVIYAAWSKHKRFYRIYIALALALNMLFTALFIGNFWVA